MSAVFVAAVAVAGLAFFLVMMAKGVRGSLSLAEPDRPSKYRAYFRRSVMTSREFEFFRSLCDALPNALVFCQVSMAAVIGVHGDRVARNSFDRKILDFVVCSHLGDVLYAIELDDRSHDSERARRRDAVKDDIAASAGLPLVRYSSVRTPLKTLREDFERISGSVVASAYATSD